jgi:CRISPR/Cas system CSM-associated protein Csm3 (group 7 of RAMP superfamily)
MKSIDYKIEFFDYWHVSSGLSSSTYADIVVNKTHEGLPFIPGKTLKGLLREAAEVIHGLNPRLVNKDFIQNVFGEVPTKEQNDQECATLEAQCFFGSAYLSSYLEKTLTEDDKPFLYNVLASTKIDSKGLAAEGTLRQLEVTIPLTLYSRIEGFPEGTDYEDQLRHCFNWIKRLGLNRSRGLGRCQFSLL